MFALIRDFRLHLQPLRVWHLTLHKVWLLSFEDNTLNFIDVDCFTSLKEVNYAKIYHSLKLHSEEITDCVEISTPMCIATCSKDKTIVLYDLKMK